MQKNAYLFIVFIFLNSFLHAQLQTFGLRVKKSGNGNQAIVFIPGLACSGAVWNSTKKKLKKKYTCYTLTMPGFVGTPAQATSSFKSWVVLIAKFIQENQLQKPIVIGHSLGASLTMALASEYPELVSKIIIVDAVPFLLALQDPSVQPYPSECTKEVDALLKMRDEDFYKMMKQSAWKFVSDTSHQKDIIDWAIRSDRKTFAQLHCDLTNTDLRQQLDKITCPALILLQPYFMDFQPSVEEQFKGLKYKKINYASSGLHFIMYDSYTWYMEQLSSFLIE